MQLTKSLTSPLTAPHAGDIWRDIDRTFPLHPLFSDGGQHTQYTHTCTCLPPSLPLTLIPEAALGQVLLFCVLKAFAANHPDIGYCQVSHIKHNNKYCHSHSATQNHTRA